MPRSATRYFMRACLRFCAIPIVALNRDDGGDDGEGLRRGDEAERRRQTGIGRRFAMGAPHAAANEDGIAGEVVALSFRHQPNILRIDIDALSPGSATPILNLRGR